MVCYTNSVGLIGMQTYCVRVEADVSDGMPSFDVVGYPGSEVREARERVRSALKNAGYSIPVKHITVNLAPANVRKSGTGFDLPMAVSIMEALGLIAQEATADLVIVGELLLSGRIGGIKGILPIVMSSKEEGYRKCIVPVENEKEARLVEGIEIIAVSSLQMLVKVLRGEAKQVQYTKCEEIENDLFTEFDFRFVTGQQAIKRGAEIAASGMHNMLMIGPPGAGKTMIAKCIPGIMPRLTKEESLEVSAIYSVAGSLNSGRQLIKNRPFVAPHHTVTEIAMTGGGVYPRPGCVSLAHLGVLFLDEMPEFSRSSLEILRQPLEEKKITIIRNTGTFEYPADFMLVGAMNPCPCGMYPDANKCTCTATSRSRYMHKLSRPLLDRMDICMHIEKLDLKSYIDKPADGETSEKIRERVVKIHEIQRERFKGTDIHFNASIPSSLMGKFCHYDKEARSAIDYALDTFDISARGFHKILKVARTIADMDASDKIRENHIMEALLIRNDNSWFET